jgi:Raf kinase inhibitor-like YbhB/YbcL family protein
MRRNGVRRMISPWRAFSAGYAVCSISPLLAMAFAPFLLVQEPRSAANVPALADQAYVTEVAIKFSLESPGFRNGGEIPRKYARAGDNLSPPLTWRDAPAGTKSFVLIIADPDAPRGTFYHWAVYDIPAATTSLPEGAGSASGALSQGVNGFGDSFYDGPQPPKGHGVHHYHFRLAALDVAALNPSSKDVAEIWAQARAHVLAETELVGTFETK